MHVQYERAHMYAYAYPMCMCMHMYVIEKTTPYFTYAHAQSCAITLRSTLFSERSSVRALYIHQINTRIFTTHEHMPDP